MRVSPHPAQAWPTPCEGRGFETANAPAFVAFTPGMSHPVSARLPHGLRFLRPPSPAPPWVGLAAFLPADAGAIRASHVPLGVFPGNDHGWVRFSLFAGSGHGP